MKTIDRVLRAGACLAIFVIGLSYGVKLHAQEPWQPVNCLDTAGQHINFSTSIGKWSCGTSAPTTFGAGTFTALTDSGLTATRVPFAGTGGLLSDDADMTFATDTLSVTKQKLTGSAITAGTMTAETVAEARTVVTSYTWTNAMVVALGAVLTGDITVATLPAKTEVKRAKVVILTPGAVAATLTVACGTVGAGYIDYVVVSDAKAAANTVYGDATAEVGTGLDGAGEGLASYTATTDVKCHFISTVANLSAVTGSTGRVVIEHTALN